MKKVLISILCVILCVVVLAGGFIGYLTIAEYNPAAAEDVPVNGTEGAYLPRSGEISLLTWNIGYAGLGAGSDFFMDGGKNTASADKATVEKYLSGIADFVSATGADISILQEVDSNSTRTYGIDQTARFSGNTAYAMNYSCPFVPFPLPPIGRVNSGLLTVTEHEITHAERISLPCPFTWPVRVANLKRCLLVSYMPIEGTNKQLALVNLHLEAYDSGEGKIAQTKQLRDFMQSEYEKGNYVIAGGDFNQSFQFATDLYPNTHPDLWTPGVLDDSILPENWGFGSDISAPTCRLLNQPYNPADTVNTQYYVIDGFIVSPNISIESVDTINLDFANSDHNPVLMKFSFK